MALTGAEHILTVKLLNWLLRGRQPVARFEPRNGHYYLDSTPRHRLTILVILAFATVLLGMGISVVPESTPSEAGLLLGIFGVMWVAALYFAHDTFASTIAFSELGLIRSGLLGSHAKIPWSRVARVEYSDHGGWFSFHSVEGTAIRISIYRSGLGTFSEFSENALKSSPAGRAPHLLYEISRNPS